MKLWQDMTPAEQEDYWREHHRAKSTERKRKQRANPKNKARWALSAKVKYNKDTEHRERVKANSRRNGRQRYATDPAYRDSQIQRSKLNRAKRKALRLTKTMLATHNQHMADVHCRKVSI